MNNERAVGNRCVSTWRFSPESLFADAVFSFSNRLSRHKKLYTTSWVEFLYVGLNCSLNSAIILRGSKKIFLVIKGMNIIFIYRIYNSCFVCSVNNNRRCCINKKYTGYVQWSCRQQTQKRPVTGTGMSDGPYLVVERGSELYRRSSTSCSRSHDIGPTQRSKQSSPPRNVLKPCFIFGVSFTISELSFPLLRRQSRVYKLKHGTIVPSRNCVIHCCKLCRYPVLSY